MLIAHDGVSLKYAYACGQMTSGKARACVPYPRILPYSVPISACSFTSAVIEAAHALVDLVVKRAVFSGRMDLPGKAEIAAVEKGVIRLQIRDRIGIRIRVHGVRLRDRFLKQRFQLRIMFGHLDQIPGDILVFVGAQKVGADCTGSDRVRHRLRRDAALTAGSERTYEEQNT